MKKNGRNGKMIIMKKRNKKKRDTKRKDQIAVRTVINDGLGQSRRNNEKGGVSSDVGKSHTFLLSLHLTMISVGMGILLSSLFAPLRRPTNKEVKNDYRRKKS